MVYLGLGCQVLIHHLVVVVRVEGLSDLEKWEKAFLNLHQETEHLAEYTGDNCQNFHQAKFV